MNSFNNAAFGFSKNYQEQMNAADAQRRANQSADSAFAEMSAEDETSLTGQPQPSLNPGGYSANINSSEFDQNTNADVNLLARAKRRAAKYLGQS